MNGKPRATPHAVRDWSEIDIQAAVLVMKPAKANVKSSLKKVGESFTSIGIGPPMGSQRGTFRSGFSQLMVI